MHTQGINKYNVVNIMHAMIGHCPWSIYSQYMYMQTHGWHHSRISFFVSSNMAHGFENLKRKWRPWEMFSRGCFASKQKPRNRDRKRFWHLALSKLKKTSQKLASCVMAFKDLHFWKVFETLWKETVSSKIKKKKGNRDEKIIFILWLGNA